MILFGKSPVFILVSQVRKIKHKRTQMKTSQKQEIEALKIFLPVVIFLFVSNVIPIIHAATLVFKKVWYREIGAAVALSAAINSAINFFIYYYQTATFKSEVKATFSKFFTCKHATQPKVRKDQENGDTDKNLVPIETSSS